MSTEKTEIFYYQYRTAHGVVGLIPEGAGRYQVMFDDEGLGSYHSAEAAADDVSGGHTFTPSNGVDLGELRIPDDLSEWEKRPFATLKHLHPPGA